MKKKRAKIKNKLLKVLLLRKTSNNKLNRMQEIAGLKILCDIFYIFNYLII